MLWAPSLFEEGCMATVLKHFKWAEDGITIQYLSPGDRRENFGAATPGLLAEGFIAEDPVSNADPDRPVLVVAGKIVAGKINASEISIPSLISDGVVVTAKIATAPVDDPEPPAEPISAPVAPETAVEPVTPAPEIAPVSEAPAAPVEPSAPVPTPEPVAPAPEAPAKPKKSHRK